MGDGEWGWYVTKLNRDSIKSTILNRVGKRDGGGAKGGREA